MSLKNNHSFCLIYSWFIKTITCFLPDQQHIMRFRGRLYNYAMPQSAKNFQVSASTILRNLENIYVGNDVYFAPNVIINALAKVTIESEVMLAFNSVIVSGNHTSTGGSYRFGKSILKPILIRKGAWVAANCTVVAGAVIGEGVLIAANSMARGLCLDEGVYSGIPAKILPKNHV